MYYRWMNIFLGESCEIYLKNRDSAYFYFYYKINIRINISTILHSHLQLNDENSFAGQH